MYDSLLTATIIDEEQKTGRKIKGDEKRGALHKIRAMDKRQFSVFLRNLLLLFL